MSVPSIAVVASRFNEKVTERLLAGCIKTLRRGGAAAPWVVRVPGAFEIPWAVHELAKSRQYDAIVALGCVLQGQTEQNRHISNSVIRSIQQIAVVTGVPCVLGVITPKTERQALARTRGRLDRGKEAAEAALEMARLRADLRRTLRRR